MADEKALCVGGPLDGKYVPVVGRRTISDFGRNAVAYDYYPFGGITGERAYLALPEGAKPMDAMRVLMEAYHLSRPKKSA